jgi:hypothetical protein
LQPYTKLFKATVALNPESAEPVGACVYSAHPFQIGLVTLAGTQQAGAALINALHRAHPEATISYLNVPADDPLLSELRRAGYQETLAQFEMLLALQD